MSEVRRDVMWHRLESRHVINQYGEIVLERDVMLLERILYPSKGTCRGSGT